MMRTFLRPNSLLALLGIILSFGWVSAVRAVNLPPPPPVPLWTGPAPESLGNRPQDIPTLTCYLPNNGAAIPPPTTAIILCPGGGYFSLLTQIEGTNEALWFQSHGIAAFVLKYRLPSCGYFHPVPLFDAMRAIRLVRSHATDWNIDPAKVGLMGFAAGGHLAGTVETHYDMGNIGAADPVDQLSSRPDFAILVYARFIMTDANQILKMLVGPNFNPATMENLSLEKQVTAQTPPTLLIFADDDRLAAENRVMFAALKKVGVTCDIQEYPKGGHGFGMGAVPDNSPKDWIQKATDWIQKIGMLVQGPF